MELPVWTVLLVALIPATGTWLYNRHKPRVDNSAEQRGWFNEVQEERDEAKVDARAERAARILAEDQHRQDRMRWDSERREWQARNDDLLRQNGAMGAELDAVYPYLWAAMKGAAERIYPPWPTPPFVMHERLHPDLLNTSLTRTTDTGVPGTEANPPFPDPPDDGQDHNPQE